MFINDFYLPFEVDLSDQDPNGQKEFERTITGAVEAKNPDWTLIRCFTPTEKQSILICQFKYPRYIPPSKPLRLKLKDAALQCH